MCTFCEPFLVGSNEKSMGEIRLNTRWNLVEIHVDFVNHF